MKGNEMKKTFLSVTFLFIISCASPAKFLCHQQEYCGQDDWQSAINSITIPNFPNDKPYLGVIYKDDFMNAWVSTGNEINITAYMLYELKTKAKRAAVAAHELAHLKQGHYYSNLGLAIIANALIITGELYLPYSSQVTNPIGRIGLAAFSRSHESEADLLAIQYLRKANYSKKDFLDLLYWMKETLPEHSFDPLLRTHPHINDRIKAIEELPDEPETSIYIMASH